MGRARKDNSKLIFQSQKEEVYIYLLKIKLVKLSALEWNKMKSVNSLTENFSQGHISKITSVTKII